jgi:murein DD-endopeptidase MepM/ murein hydrolase activator NlpD
MALSRPRATSATVLVALTAATWPSAVAARGSADVAALQVALRAQRLYAGSVDGVEGPGTEAALRRLQRRAGLDADAIAGPLTRRALGRRGRPELGSRVVAPGDRGWDVAALQFLLAWRGFPSGAIDGGFGEHTEAALIRYQRWAGLSADGRAGPATLRSVQQPAPRAPATLSFPVAAALGDRFGPRGDRFHSGIDLLAAAAAPVGAAGAGTVTFAGWEPGGYGNLVVIDHANGVSSWYAHLSRIDVTSGASMTTATRVGLVGATGNATGPHLHFEVRVRGAVTDPLAALRIGGR